MLYDESSFTLFIPVQTESLHCENKLIVFLTNHLSSGIVIQVERLKLSNILKCEMSFFSTQKNIHVLYEEIYIYEDLNSHLLTLTQLAEESTALTVCPFALCD